MLTDKFHMPLGLFLQVLTVSATRENEVQQLVVTFTGNTTDGGVKMMADATTNAFVELTFDSGSMNWACTDATETTSQVRVCTHTRITELFSGVCMYLTDLTTKKWSIALVAE